MSGKRSEETTSVSVTINCQNQLTSVTCDVLSFLVQMSLISSHFFRLDNKNISLLFHKGRVGLSYLSNIKIFTNSKSWRNRPKKTSFTHLMTKLIGQKQLPRHFSHLLFKISMHDSFMHIWHREIIISIICSSYFSLLRTKLIHKYYANWESAKRTGLSASLSPTMMIDLI